MLELSPLSFNRLLKPAVIFLERSGLIEFLGRFSGGDLSESF